ncbi:hypothetical protein [Marinobacter lipolyticus]|uniref:hypothetical protein n=1 Tax=Marinobacter lipolyticus TaxID=209639 RepID=UPI003A917CDB
MKRTDSGHTRSLSLAILMVGTTLVSVVPGQSNAHQPPSAEGTPEGIVRASVLQEGGIEAMGVTILDAPKPAIMVSYRGEEVLTVFDSDNEPFLRFHRDRVEANTQSSLWEVVTHSQNSASGGDPSWVQVSGSGTFGWVDPRLSAGHIDPDTATGWRIPVRQGQRAMSAITGRLSWRALTANVTPTHQ